MLPSLVAVMDLPETSSYHGVAVAPSITLKLVITALLKRDLDCIPQSSAWIQRELCFPISSDPQSHLFQQPHPNRSLYFDMISLRLRYFRL